MRRCRAQREWRFHENIKILHFHAEGSAGGGRSHQPPADAARRHHPPRLGRDLHLAAARHARAAQSGGNRAQRDEPRRRDGAGHAGGAAGRAVAGIGPLAGVRPGAAALERPPRARLRDPADLGGGDHRARARRAEELPASAGALLPDPDQVPRRAPAALRHHARARVRDEGRLLVPRRLRRPAARVPQHARHLHAHLHPARPQVPRRRRRHRRHRRHRLA